MSWAATKWARAQPIAPRIRLLLYELADMVNDLTAECYPKVATLARKLGVEVRAVQYQLASLEKLGVLTRIFRRGRSTLYRLNLGGTAEPQKRRVRGRRIADPAQFEFAFPTLVEAAQDSPESGTTLHHQGCKNKQPEPASLVQPVEDSPSLRSVRDPRPNDARTLAWQEGVGIVLRLTGRPQGACRRLVGLLLKHLRDDCAALMELLRETERDRRIAPVDWLIAAAKHRGSSAGRRRQAVDGLLAEITAYEARMKAGDMTALAWGT
jgi:DNA-binding transcriptional ArsR family regulator